MSKKKKKKKTVYYDDGRTIYDMSGVSGRKSLGDNPNVGRPHASFGEQFKTYKAAVKTMIIPMFVTLGIIAVAFGLLYLILTVAG